MTCVCNVLVTRGMDILPAFIERLWKDNWTLVLKSAQVSVPKLNHSRPNFTQQRAAPRLVPSFNVPDFVEGNLLDNSQESVFG